MTESARHSALKLVRWWQTEIVERDEALPWSTFWKRTEFARTMERVAPEVLDTLRADVLPYYDRLVTEVDGEDMIAQDLAFGDALAHLIDWAFKFGLAQPWCYRAAWGTLSHMRKNSKFAWFTAPLPAGWEIIPFRLELPGWNVGAELRAKAKARIRNEVLSSLDKALEDHLDACEANMLAHGWTRPRKVRRRGGKIPAHMEWFVRWQCQGWTKARIADEYRADRREVTREIKRLSRELYLMERKGKAGRPEKQGDNNGEI
jgi:hypothetical protein